MTLNGDAFRRNVHVHKISPRMVNPRHRIQKKKKEEEEEEEEEEQEGIPSNI